MHGQIETRYNEDNDNNNNAKTFSRNTGNDVQKWRLEFKLTVCAYLPQTFSVDNSIEKA